MTVALVATDDISRESFAQRLDPYRREMLVHCYRMVGSVEDAEDLVQETMMRAWRARARYDEGVASMRTWLYKIATNACLSWLDGRARRVLPSNLVEVSHDPHAALTPALDVPWLEPLPGNDFSDPATHALHRSTVRLALIAALQLLPPRQRAVFLLREVLDYPAAETARLIDMSVPAVNSALQRARATVATAAPSESTVDEPDDRAVRATVDRYARAFAAADVDGLVALVTEEVLLEMPPVPLWYRGRGDYGSFMARVFTLRGNDWRAEATSANGQPALAAYVREDDGYRLHSIQVFTVTGAGISRTTVFAAPAVLAHYEPSIAISPS